MGKGSSQLLDTLLLCKGHNLKGKVTQSLTTGGPVDCVTLDQTGSKNVICVYLTILLFSIYRVESVQHIHTSRQLANINMLVIQYVEIIKPFVIECNMFRSFISCVYILYELFGVMHGQQQLSRASNNVNRLQQLEHKSRALEYSTKAAFPL